MSISFFHYINQFASSQIDIIKTYPLLPSFTTTVSKNHNNTEVEGFTLLFWKVHFEGLFAQVNKASNEVRLHTGSGMGLIFLNLLIFTIIEVMFAHTEYANTTASGEASGRVFDSMR